MRVDIGNESLFLMQWYREHGDSDLWRRASRILEELATYRAREARPPARPAIEGQMVIGVEVDPGVETPEQTAERILTDVRLHSVSFPAQPPETAVVFQPGRPIRCEHRVTWAGALHDTLIAAEKAARSSGIPQTIKQPKGDGWFTSHEVRVGDRNSITGLYATETVVWGTGAEE